MASIPEQATVQATLQPYQDKLRWIIHTAWQDWLNCPYRGQFLYPRTRASMVWEWIVQHAEDVLAADPGIDVIKRKREQTVWFLVDNQVLLRFKQGDEHGLSSNFPTQAALAFHDPQVNLPGMPEVARVEVVYVLNFLKTAIASIQVVARNNNHIAWAYEIPDVKLSTSVVELSITPARATPPKQLVKLRQPDEGQHHAIKPHSEE
ncbi:MAG: hypothetical protein U1F76_14245 [Candidatus Competibacteraceae bacterium]